jgi:hypothetical protein
MSFAWGLVESFVGEEEGLHSKGEKAGSAKNICSGGLKGRSIYV